jgi:hypothetical protein
MSVLFWAWFYSNTRLNLFAACPIIIRRRRRRRRRKRKQHILDMGKAAP